ncbi:hypothetical protein GUJ93_ZPchr0009g2264 [Zizania palustris]|uniref:Uncharacterized protein n=1 Tax=Zizania palustris TaxID=103762 RepID=A0A8J5V8D9_ZIZPA|nr:hypothetical protein GUJ93_ZPchr0009g2264 [Zizania palustris]
MRMMKTFFESMQSLVVDPFFPQGTLKNEGYERYGVRSSTGNGKRMHPTSALAHYPVREPWNLIHNCWRRIRILAHEGKSVLVVAHNAVNQALVATSLGWTLHFRIILQSNFGASVLDFTPKTGGRPPNV